MARLSLPPQDVAVARSLASKRFDRQIPLDQSFHDEMTGHRHQIEAIDELPVKRIISRHPTRDDLDAIVPFAANAVELRHTGQTLDMVAECLCPWGGVAGSLYHDDHRQIEAQSSWIHDSAAPPPEACCLEPLQPSPARVVRETNTLGQNALACLDVVVERSQQRQIDLIDCQFFLGQIHTTNLVVSKNR